MADLATAFPEGRYTVRGKSFDGTVLTGRATFTHDVPAPPAITSPEIAEDPEQTGIPVARDDLVVGWDPVTETTTGEPVTITGYGGDHHQRSRGRPTRVLTTDLRRAHTRHAQHAERPH